MGMCGYHIRCRNSGIRCHECKLSDSKNIGTFLDDMLAPLPDYEQRREKAEEKVGESRDFS